MKATEIAVGETYVVTSKQASARWHGMLRIAKVIRQRTVPNRNARRGRYDREARGYEKNEWTGVVFYAQDNETKVYELVDCENGQTFYASARHFWRTLDVHNAAAAQAAAEKVRRDDARAESWRVYDEQVRVILANLGIDISTERDYAPKHRQASFAPTSVQLRLDLLAKHATQFSISA